MAASDYNRLVPQATDQLNVSQGDLLLNFGAIPDLLDVDHVDFASVGAGKHKRITFPVQSPAPTFTAGDLGLYSFLDPVTATNELYFNSFTSVNIPITASILSTNAAPGNSSAGWAYLPSGILLKWGNDVANGSTIILYPVAGDIPVFTAVCSVQLTTMGTGTDVFVQLQATLGPLGFVGWGSERTTTAAAGVTFQYLAIGY